MIVNPDKFQSMIISSKKDLSKSVLNINGVELTMESSVKLLGIELDNKLNLKKNIYNIYKKASNQLNVICRLQKFMGHKEKEAIINTFVHSNFNYGCLIWYLSSKSPKIKWKNSRKESKVSIKWIHKQLYRTSWKIHISINWHQKTLCDGLWNFQNTKKLKSSFYERYISLSTKCYS